MTGVNYSTGAAARSLIPNPYEREFKKKRTAPL